MKTYHSFSSLALLTCLCACLGSSNLTFAEPTKAQQAAISRASSEMAAAAKRFLASLPEEQRQ
ncbi:MAG TPA: hypothetical protein DCM07_27220, partial [Planctomycetaceae bacterium]|nr:hypothetical protein [Planctomycetaceae bacterium]